MRCDKLRWHYTESCDRAELPDGELGVGKSHLLRHGSFLHLTPWPASLPSVVPEKVAYGAAESKGSGTDGVGEGKSLSEKHLGQTLALGLHLAWLKSSRSS